jgi:lysozyme
MSAIIPPSLPKASPDLVRKLAAADWVAAGYNLKDLPGVYQFACRGYRLESMGNPKRNDVGMYDDACFLVTPWGVTPVNCNVDPSRFGWNPGVGKPFAQLKAGVWWFRPGPHKGVMPALRQCDEDEAARLSVPNNGRMTVLRVWGLNDSRNYEETGYFAINQHPGGWEGTSSWACLTYPPTYAKRFLQDVCDALAKAKQKVIPCILHDGPIC